MGYRNEGFYNLKDNDGMSGPYMGAETASNAHFKYPSKNIRFLAAEERLNNPTNPNDYKIQRGYIRGLQQPGVTGGNFQPLKCSFQFNPQQITQVVTMREDVYLPIMQDPIQFTQPFGAMTNFNFDLLFDRSREVASGNYYTDDGSASGDQYTAADRDNINYKSDVRDIGAMADLQVLYSIIGQGFSQETLQFQASRLRQAGVTQLNKDGGTDATDPNAVTSDNIDSKVDAYINSANIGNSAFLIPNPVRVIFSSMFMVDGFITGTSVDFLKFNTNMVPLQVRVGLTMNAIYIGFAREKTFLTEQLDQQAAAIKEQAAQDAAVAEELQTTADIILNRFGYACVIRSSWAGGEIEKDVQGAGNYEWPPIYQYAFENGAGAYGNWGRSFNVGFITKDIKDLPTPKKFTEDHTVSFKWWFTVWASPDATAAAKIRDAKGSGYNGSIVGNYAGNANSSNGWKSWDKLYLSYDWEGLPDSVFKAAPRLSNGGSSRYRHTSSSSTYTTAQSKYYTTKFYVQVTVSTTSNGNNIEKSATGEMWQVLQGNAQAYASLKLNWGATGNRPLPGKGIRS